MKGAETINLVVTDVLRKQQILNSDAKLRNKNVEYSSTPKICREYLTTKLVQKHFLE